MLQSLAQRPEFGPSNSLSIIKRLSLKKAGKVTSESLKNANCGPALIWFLIFKKRNYLGIVIKSKGSHRVIRLVPCEDKEQPNNALYFRSKVLANKI